MTTIPRLVSYQIRSYGRLVHGGNLVTETSPIRTHESLNTQYQEWTNGIRSNYLQQNPDISSVGISVYIISVSTFEASK